MSELEDILGNVNTVSELYERAKLLESETLRTWHKRLNAINAALPQYDLGDRLLKEINNYAQQLSKEDAVQIIEFSSLRLRLHTDKGTYKKEFKKIDDNIYELPKIVCDMKRSVEDPALPCLFLEYWSESPHTSIQHLLDCFKNVVNVKKWYEEVPEEFKILPIMRDDPQMGAGTWENLRKLLQPGNPQDIKYGEWIDKFESMETNYNFSFTNVIDLISKYRLRNKDKPRQ